MVITPTITCPRIRLFKHALRPIEDEQIGAGHCWALSPPDHYRQPIEHRLWILRLADAQFLAGQTPDLPKQLDLPDINQIGHLECTFLDNGIARIRIAIDSMAEAHDFNSL